MLVENFDVKLTPVPLLELFAELEWSAARPSCTGKSTHDHTDAARPRERLAAQGSGYFYTSLHIPGETL
jgi:hypothetical protein